MTRTNVLPEAGFLITSGAGFDSVAATAMIAPHTITEIREWILKHEGPKYAMKKIGVLR
jgi:hypothetical protein